MEDVRLVIFTGNVIPNFEASHLGLVVEVLLLPSIPCGTLDTVLGSSALLNGNWSTLDLGSAAPTRTNGFDLLVPCI